MGFNTVLDVTRLATFQPINHIHVPKDTFGKPLKSGDIPAEMDSVRRGETTRWRKVVSNVDKFAVFGNTAIDFR